MMMSKKKKKTDHRFKGAAFRANQGDSVFVAERIEETDDAPMRMRVRVATVMDAGSLSLGGDHCARLKYEKTGEMWREPYLNIYDVVPGPNGHNSNNDTILCDGVRCEHFVETSAAAFERYVELAIDERNRLDGYACHLKCAHLRPRIMGIYADTTQSSSESLASPLPHWHLLQHGYEHKHLAFHHMLCGPATPRRGRNGNAVNRCENCHALFFRISRLISYCSGSR